MAVPERQNEVHSVSSGRRTLPVSNVRGPRLESAPSPLQVSRMLWILLGLSALFLVSVRIYAQRFWHPAAVSAESVAEIPILDVISPVIPVRAGELSLGWDTVPGAVQYHLRIHTLQGTPVVDPMLVWGQQWRPSDQLLPGLTPGPYRWTVEAVDGAGRLLARSLPMDLEIE